MEYNIQMMIIIWEEEDNIILSLRRLKQLHLYEKTWVKTALNFT